MYIQDKRYNKLNEILYVLSATNHLAALPISKIALQKLLYLSGSLAPIKDIILSFLKFKSIQRGPYSSEIQNIVDHLVACGLVEIVDFRIKKDKNSIAYYRISEGGQNAVDSLVKYSVEEEKYWWISSVTKLAHIFSKSEHLKSNNQYDGLDKIVFLVYQDQTFKKVKGTMHYSALIDFNDTHGVTNELIESVKDYLKQNESTFTITDERKQAELILLGFFEHFLANYISEHVKSS